MAHRKEDMSIAGSHWMTDDTVKNQAATAEILLLLLLLLLLITHYHSYIT